MVVNWFSLTENLIEFGWKMELILENCFGCFSSFFWLISEVISEQILDKFRTVFKANSVISKT
jgi:hypothetical protein